MNPPPDEPFGKEHGVDTLASALDYLDIIRILVLMVRLCEYRYHSHTGPCFTTM